MARINMLSNEIGATVTRAVLAVVAVANCFKRRNPHLDACTIAVWNGVCFSEGFRRFLETLEVNISFNVYFTSIIRAQNACPYESLPPFPVITSSFHSRNSCRLNSSISSSMSVNFSNDVHPGAKSLSTIGMFAIAFSRTL